MGNKSSGTEFLVVLLLGILIGGFVTITISNNLVDGLCGVIHARNIALYRECRQQPQGNYGSKYHIHLTN